MTLRFINRRNMTLRFINLKQRNFAIYKLHFIFSVQMCDLYIAKVCFVNSKCVTRKSQKCDIQITKVRYINHKSAICKSQMCDL